MFVSVSKTPTTIRAYYFLPQILRSINFDIETVSSNHFLIKGSDSHQNTRNPSQKCVETFQLEE